MVYMIIFLISLLVFVTTYTIESDDNTKEYWSVRFKFSKKTKIFKWIMIASIVIGVIAIVLNTI